MPAAMTGRILKQARAQQEELDAEAAPAAAAALAASGARGLVAAAAKGLQDSDDDFSGTCLAWRNGLPRRAGGWAVRKAVPAAWAHARRSL